MGQSIVINLGHLYFGLAILYNIFNQLTGDVIRRSLSPTDPAFGSVLITSAYLVFLMRDIAPLPGWTIMLGAMIFFIARFGVLEHVFNKKSDGYLNYYTRFIAV